MTGCIISENIFEEGKSITEISRETGLDRKDGKVYLEKEIGMSPE